MERFLKCCLYLTLLVLFSTVSRSNILSSNLLDDNYTTNYVQKNTTSERTLDYLLAHHLFDTSHAISNSINNKTYKVKSLFTHISHNFSGNITSYNRLFVTKNIDNLFLFKNSHYIFKLRKILI